MKKNTEMKLQNIAPTFYARILKCSAFLYPTQAEKHTHV